ncbi:IS1249 family transposase, partial [Agromyces seonyuensis]
EQLRKFVTWVTGKHTQAELDGTATGRSFRRQIAWCWDVQPSLGPCETIHHAVLVDGIWVGTWCLLIALSDTGRVLAWQWCGGESVAAWTALFERIPAPGVLVSDGGTGLPTALHTCWPETKHQRCLFHLQMNITRHLTRTPRTEAGRALRGLAMQLSGIWSIEDAIVWQQRLDQWWQAFGHLTRERTLLRNGHFGFTHDRLRKAWFLIRTVVARQTVFTYLLYGNPRTTSPLEGGINSQIRDLLRRHRGMSEEHRRRAVEWFLTLHELPLEQALALAKTTPPSPTNKATPPEHASPYDTGLSDEEGLWTRKGWAGRS